MTAFPVEFPDLTDDDEDSAEPEEVAFAPAPPISTARSDAAWAWFESIGSPQQWVAPLVGYSEPAFRLLCRHYGAEARRRSLNQPIECPRATDPPPRAQNPVT